MENLKKCMIIIFGVEKDISTLSQHLAKFVNLSTPLYRYNTFASFTILVFYSKEELDVIRQGMVTSGFPHHFMIHDITVQGVSFDYHLPIELTNFLFDELEIINTQFELDNSPMDLDSLLELVSKNGWASLTDKQKEELKKYSK